MVKYSCERCAKDFSQKSHYDSHNRRKTPCENNADKIKQLVDKAVEKKLNNENKMTKESKKEITNKKKLTIVETFVGCGGAHLGFQQNGFESLLVNFEFCHDCNFQYFQPIVIRISCHKNHQ